MVASVAALVTLFYPRAALAARGVRRYASRGQEQKATFVTAAVIGLAFFWAYFRSNKEDSNEDIRIRNEVERLARLKKEFEEGENAETDDDMAASLAAAAKKLSDDKEAPAEDGSEKTKADASDSGGAADADDAASGSDPKSSPPDEPSSSKP